MSLLIAGGGGGIHPPVADGFTLQRANNAAYGGEYSIIGVTPN